MARGTSGRLVNIAGRFLHIFSDLETLIRNIFPGGARNPYSPTELKVLELYTVFYPSRNIPSLGDIIRLCVPHGF